MRTRTKGIQVQPDGTRIVNKQYRGERIFERLGAVSQADAEAWLRQQQEQIDLRRERESAAGPAKLFREAAGKYLMEVIEDEKRSAETIAIHIESLNAWVGDVTIADTCNDTFSRYKADRLDGFQADGTPCRPVKASTVNRALEVARTICNRAARVWRLQGQPWIPTPPLIEMLDEDPTKRKPYPITWAEQAALFPRLPDHLARMALFSVNTGARDENVCGLRWDWERPVPELGRSVFLIPAEEFKTNRPHVLILNDTAWNIVEQQRGKDPVHVFVYRRERSDETQWKYERLGKGEPAPYRRIETMNNTGWQNARAATKVPARVHDLRHTFGQRLRDAGVPKEDRALLMGHVEQDMPQHYATATIANLVDQANKVMKGEDRTTVLRLITGGQTGRAGESRAESRATEFGQKKTG